MTNQQRIILTVLSTSENVPLYRLTNTSVAKYGNRISELRQMGWDIPKPKLGKNRNGNVMSTYSMPLDERVRAQEVLSE
jgi:hypothetical protein